MVETDLAIVGDFTWVFECKRRAASSGLGRRSDTHVGVPQEGYVARRGRRRTIEVDTCELSEHYQPLLFRMLKTMKGPQAAVTRELLGHTVAK